MSEKTDAAPGALSRLLGAIGLGARARALTLGTEQVVEAIRSGKPPRLVLEASDTSGNTHKKLNDKCAFYRVRIEQIPVTADALAQAVGKTASVAALAVTDEHFSALIEGALEKTRHSQEEQA